MSEKSETDQRETAAAICYAFVLVSWLGCGACLDRVNPYLAWAFAFATVFVVTVAGLVHVLKGEG